MIRRKPTFQVVVGAVHHVGGVDEVVAGSLHADLQLVVAQNHLPSVDQSRVTAPLHHPPFLRWRRCLPAVDAQRGEVQLVFGLEDEGLGADLQDGWLLQRSSDGEQGQLWRNQLPVLGHPVLAVKKLQAAVEVQGLKREKRYSCDVQEA